MRNLKKMLIVVLVFINIKTYAEQSINRQINFSGTIKDSKNRNITSISIGYNVEDNFQAGNGNKSFVVNVEENGNFKFSLPDLGKPLWFAFAFHSPNQFIGVSGSYYAESKDNIHAKIKIGLTDTIMFSGHGSSKYNLIYQLEKQYWKSYYAKLGTLNLKKNNNSSELRKSLDCLSELIMEFESKKMNLINDKKNQLRPEIKNLIKYSFGNYNSEWNFRIAQLYKTNKIFKEQISDYYKRNENRFTYEPDTLKTLPPSYINELSIKAKHKLTIGRQLDTANVVDFYNLLKDSYTGILRDRLLSDFVLNTFAKVDVAPYITSTMDSLISDAEKTVVIPYIKQVLTDNLKLQKGTKLFTSPFVDLNGEKFDIESLKGKAVLIDLWFLGCSGCAQFHKKFENEIYPLLKKHKNLVILSLNIDRSLENWQKGINCNLYTSKDYLNVATGNGLDHPFIKYYNIKGGPYLMLIDINGNIYSRLDPSQAVDQKKIMDLVKGALTTTRISL